MPGKKQSIFFSITELSLSINCLYRFIAALHVCGSYLLNIDGSIMVFMMGWSVLSAMMQINFRFK